MSRRSAVITLVVSLTLLIGALGVWVVQGNGEGRADLVGSAATTVPPPPATTPAPTTTAVPPLPGLPVGLTIPALGLDAPVVEVGLESDGEMEVPPATEAGWYRYGSRPGESTGNAVIAAHVDYGGQKGVFFDLRRLEVGDEVVVTDEVGSTHRFSVAERYQVDKDDLAVAQIFVTDGPPGLTLITCGGSFDRSVRSYDDNIVVRAVEIGAT